MLNGTDTDNEEGVPRTIKMTAQIFADRLFPVTTIGNFIAPQPFQAGRVVRKVAHEIHERVLRLRGCCADWFVSIYRCHDPFPLIGRY